MKKQINLHNLQIHYNLCTRALFALYITISKCQHTTRVMATHHEIVGGSGEPLQIPINEVFTFQGRPDKWGFTVSIRHFKLEGIEVNTIILWIFSENEDTNYRYFWFLLITTKTRLKAKLWKCNSRVSWY